MSELSAMPNLGKIAEKRLKAVGIEDSETLIRLGSHEAYKRLKIHEGDTCINTLYALEGAIQDIRWHDLPQEVKDDLKKFFDSLI